MKQKKILRKGELMGYKKFLFVFLGLLLLGSGLVMAISNATATRDADLARWGGETSAGSITTEGGNISQVNVSAGTLTDRWAGFFGPVDGYIYLTDAGNATTSYLFRWTASAPSGWICVSTNNNFPFASAEGTTAAAINSAWNFGSATDNATNTFTLSTCDITFYNPSNSISDTATADHAGSSTFETCAIVRTGGTGETDFAFCSAINQAGTNYAGVAADYELIVPTTLGSETETYYFYAELN
ncbi:MAG: hypothetical protein QW255_02010 [Candidatus Bilamarchaeaceae archaeon]